MSATPDDAQNDAQKRDALEEALRGFVGAEVAPPRPAPDPVNEPMIRHWCEAMGDANPVYTDPDFAAQSVHGGIVSPPTMLQAWTLRGLRARQPDEPVDRLNQLLDLLTQAGFDSIVATDCEQDYARYLRAGERVVSSEVIESISEEKATALGPGRFIETRISFRTEEGELVGSQLFRLLKFRAARRPAGETPRLEKPRRLRPVINEDNAFFWEGVEQGELRLQACSACEKLRHPPRPMCPWCQSLHWKTARASGRGSLYSFVVVHHPPLPPFEYPFAVALVALEEGVRLVSNLVDVDLARVEIGMPVEVAFREVEEGFTLPLFRPVG